MAARHGQVEPPAKQHEGFGVQHKYVDQPLLGGPVQEDNSGGDEVEEREAAGTDAGHEDESNEQQENPRAAVAKEDRQRLAQRAWAVLETDRTKRV
ncbi:MAG TPA: hypothetical protein VKM54_14605 [Myxococcota bacterium]|nr:hypothetical protein [Myxococcota bacterium]